MPKRKKSKEEKENKGREAASGETPPSPPTKTLTLEISRPAAKDLAKLDKKTALQIDKRIRTLASAPRPHDSEKLEGYDNLYRLRVGNFRILYLIDGGRLRILIIRVLNRKDAYKNLP